MRTLRAAGTDAVGVDCKPSAFTNRVGSIVDATWVHSAMAGVDTVFHTATLHKPHVATHAQQDFVDTNVTGTLNLLQAAVARGVQAFVFTSTTSAFGDALRPPIGEPAAWITESVVPAPRNIYGVTKTAAEDLCRLYARNHGLNCVVLRTSRFFPEQDDDPLRQRAFDDANLKVNEYLYRRVELSDVVSAHQLAARRASQLHFGLYIISATSPFSPADVETLNHDAPAVVRARVPAYQSIYERLGWRMLPTIDRVYVNDAARRDLGWQPRFNFADLLAQVADGALPQSQLARDVGSKGYHDQSFSSGPYPVDAH